MPTVSIISVSPCQWPTESPIGEGARFLGWFAVHTDVADIVVLTVNNGNVTVVLASIWKLSSIAEVKGGATGRPSTTIRITCQ
jgi:hypothetical protein